MPPAVGPRMQMYPPGGPPMGQQLFYGQGPPAMIPQVKLKALSIKHLRPIFITFFSNWVSNSLDSDINNSLYRV